MRIVNLIENTAGREGCLYEHGLSFYIETEAHRILLDTGATGAAIDNAATLGIDLTQVDLLFLSHGHYDHSGGIPRFAALNPNARIYMQRSALGEHLGDDPDGLRYIGIAPEIATLPQLCLLDGSTVIDEKLSLLSEVTGRRHFSKSNLRLLVRRDGQIFPDDFAHEQSLVIRQPDGYYLFSGCAHNGILNILDRFRDVYGCSPRLVVSGFHFMKPTEHSPEEVSDILAVGRELAQMDTEFYTGHCTGLPAYQMLKQVMGDRLHYIHSCCEIPL